jgi:hypothetical protein
MTRTLRAAAAAATVAAAPVRAFEAAPDRLGTFRPVDPGAGQLVATAADLAAPFAPLALVAVVALYVLAESRLFAAR